MNYEELLKVAEQSHLIVKEKPLRANDGRIKGRKIAIRQNMTQTEKACTLAEELGHHHTSHGDILDQSNTSNRKQERRARLWGYKCMFDLTDIIQAYKYGCRNRFEVAEFLGVTEPYLLEAVQTYRGKYGICTKIDRYLVYFEPFGVLEFAEGF